MRNCGYALAAAVVEVAERGPTTAQVALDVGQREGRTLGGTDGDCCGSAAELREGGGSDRIGGRTDDVVGPIGATSIEAVIPCAS